MSDSELFRVTLDRAGRGPAGHPTRESDHAQLLHWSDLFAAGDADLLDQIVEAIGQWNEYILSHASTVRGRGNTDLISLMCDAEREGKRLNDTDLMFEAMLVLVGGDETTRHVISAGVDALLRHPDQLALLREDPSLIPSAVEEMLRWATPVKWSTRRPLPHSDEATSWSASNRCPFG